MNILEAIRDPNLFARWFKDPETWRAWLAFLAALFALPMDEQQAETYRRHTGRSVQPAAPFSEGWLVVGRRGGKSFIMALVAVFLGCFRDYRRHLQPGERATVMVIAADRRQARVILRYIGGLLRGVPMLRRMIERETAEGFELSNAVAIEVGTASFRTTRGYTFAAVLCDEVAFWSVEDAAEPDHAILDAVRPGMATIPGAVLICASSPYSRRGALWEAHKRYHGKDDAPVLVWQADTRSMNPSVPDRVIADAYERDPASAAAEYGAQFRTDVESLLTREAVGAVIDSGVFERARQQGIAYVGFVDPSGGSADAMTLAVAHRDGDRAVLDMVREVKPPFSPESVVREFCGALSLFGISEVVGDRYAGEWPREQFRKHGVEYRLSDANRSELYLALLPMVNSKTVALLDVPRLEAQLIGLERRTSRGGRDSIDHAPGSHDDLANAVAGALHVAMRPVVKPAVAMFGIYCDQQGYEPRQLRR